MIDKLKLIASETIHLVRRHKLLFLLPLLILLAVLTFLVVEIGPSVIVSFIYAGI